jgi:hypothetical protein
MHAQAHPLVYSVVPDRDATRSRAIVYGDFAYGRDLFAAVGPEELEQRIGAEVIVAGPARIVAQVGWAATAVAVRSRAMAQAELLVSLARGSRAALAVGFGGMRDYDGVGVALGRMAVAFQWPRSLLAGNLRLERPLTSGTLRRDAVDVITTLGISHQIAPGLRLGVEAVAQDLEGFFEADEAEGGAKVMFGPTLNVGSPDARWGLTIAGGPVLQLTRSSAPGGTSGAARDLTTNAGYVVRTSISRRW